MSSKILTISPQRLGGFAILAALLFVTRNTHGAWINTGPNGDIVGENGRIRSIQIIPNFPNLGDYYVFVGASGGGLWRATGSAGPIWTSLGENLTNQSVAAFAVHPFIPNDIVVGTGDYQRYDGGGMFHTTDGGNSWLKMSLFPSSNAHFFRIFRLPGNLDTLMAATDQGLYRSTNGPEGPWINVLSGIVSDLALDPRSSSIQFCVRATYGGSGGGIYKSINAGVNWDLVTSEAISPSNFGTGRIAICRDQPNTIAFICENNCNVTNNGISGVFKSNNGGTNWANITGTVDLGNQQACHVMAITIRPNNASEIFVAANNTFRSHDGGQTWTGDSAKPHQDITQYLFSSSTGDDQLWQCNDGGIYLVNVPANTWNSWNGNSSSGLSVGTIFDIDARGTVRAIGKQDDGVAMSGNGGNSWTGYGCCDIYSVAVTDPANPSFWYANRTDAGIVITKQLLAGSIFTVSDTVATLPKQDGNLAYEPFSARVFSLFQDPTSRSLVSFPASATGKGPWTRELTGLPSGANTLTCSPFNGQTIYVWQESVGILKVLNKSGGTWSVTRTANIGAGYNIGTVCASPDRAGECWAGLVTTTRNPAYVGLGGSEKILHTTDDWQTTNVLSALPAPAGQVTGIAVTPGFTSQIFVATDVGVYWTVDGGQTWMPFQTGLPASVYCSGLRYVKNGSATGHDTLALATFGRGMYEANVPGIVFVDQRNNSGNEDGSVAHPFNTVAEGINATPVGGVMAVNGVTVHVSPSPLTKPMTIISYEASATLTH